MPIDSRYEFAPHILFGAVGAFRAVGLAGCYAYGGLLRRGVKVTMENVLKEMNKMRQDLRELKIQRDRDQRVIEELRQIVENSIPDLPVEGPHPSVALPSESPVTAGAPPAAEAPTEHSQASR